MGDFPPGTIFIEIRGVYDGWSAAQLPSGELVNRWPQEDRRHRATQEWIAQNRDFDVAQAPKEPK